MFSFDFTAEIPSEKPGLVGGAIKAIQSAVRRNVDKPYILIEYVSPDIVERLVDSPRLRGLKASKLFYDADLRKLIIKLPSNIHEAGVVVFERIIYD
ncbi:uncharacterized protein LDX57_010169 [Aspergillus melleus]|uniref:uncharacterized protein n=1 Tax=Aspergillus melleus TaxID=138277 RepID=UPI001E8EC171|nr:uncharacterized protein LDX57_010169 [Aspergillus melleus]KAH8432533.1 hypothetical protein LDX57_010169 [Aspergillus melleus]